MIELITEESCPSCMTGKSKRMFATPWCEMLREGAGRHHILNFWYKLDRMRKEIEKRTSYLGKFRRTEEAQHLLDLISMTEDEKDMFYVIANEAMADVFDLLTPYAPKHIRSYMWDENIPYKVVTEETDEFEKDDLIEWNGKLYMAWLSNELVPVGIVFDDTETEPAISTTALRDEENDLKGKTYPYCFYDEDNDHLFYCAKEEPEVGDKVYEYDHDDEFMETGDVTNIAMGWDGIPLEKKLVETFDWRNSIHYLLAFPKEWNKNIAEPLDTAIFEALVAQIIYKWLLYAYPDDAPRFQAEREDNFEKIRVRARKLFGKNTVNRIPRYL